MEAIGLHNCLLVVARVVLAGQEELAASVVRGVLVEEAASVAPEELAASVVQEELVVLVATGLRNCLQVAIMRGSTTRSIGVVLLMAIGRRRIDLVVRRVDLL